MYNIQYAIIFRQSFIIMIHYDNYLSFENVNFKQAALDYIHCLKTKIRRPSVHVHCISKCPVNQFPSYFFFEDKNDKKK